MTVYGVCCVSWARALGLQGWQATSDKWEFTVKLLFGAFGKSVPPRSRDTPCRKGPKEHIACALPLNDCCTTHICCSQSQGAQATQTITLTE